MDEEIYRQYPQGLQGKLINGMQTSQKPKWAKNRNMLTKEVTIDKKHGQQGGYGMQFCRLCQRPWGPT